MINYTVLSGASSADNGGGGIFRTGWGLESSIAQGMPSFSFRVRVVQPAFV